MFKENVMFGLRKMNQQMSNTVYIILGLGITIATVVLLYTILVSKENPNNKFINPERLVFSNNTKRSTGDNNWGSQVNFRLIKEAIERIDILQEKTIYNTNTHQRWVNEERYKSRILYTDHRMVNFINFQWIHGSFFSEEDYKSENKVILLSAKSAIATFGSTDVMGKYCEVFDEKFRVIGVFKNIPDRLFSMDEIVPITTDKNKDRDTSIKASSYDYSSLIMAKNVNDIASIKEIIHENSKTFKIFPENYILSMYPFTIQDDLYTLIKVGEGGWNLNSENYNNFINSLILILILSVICFVNVTNLTMTSFLNRNIELGVRISFGGTWKDIFKQGIIESTLFFIISFFIGLILSQLFLTLLNGLDLYTNYRFKLRFDSILLIAAYTFFVPLIANLISCQKVVKQKQISLLKGLAA